MFDDLRELYQEMILDHGKNPRNFGRPEVMNHEAEGDNPMCGDHIHVYLLVGDDGRIGDVKFDGRGCAISVASASLMTGVVKGRTVAEAEALFHDFQEMCTTDPGDNGDGGAFAQIDPDAVEKLRVMAGVRQYPMRVKCATLAWHTMNAALEGDRAATTE